MPSNLTARASPPCALPLIAGDALQDLFEVSRRDHRVHQFDLLVRSDDEDIAQLSAAIRLDVSPETAAGRKCPTGFCNLEFGARRRIRRGA